MSARESESTGDDAVVSPFRSAHGNGQGTRPRHAEPGDPHEHPSRHRDRRLDDVRGEIETLLDSREDWRRVAGDTTRARYAQLCAIEKVLLTSEQVLTTTQQGEQRDVLLVTITNPRADSRPPTPGP